jgi:hypothetical protein
LCFFFSFFFIGLSLLSTAEGSCLVRKNNGSDKWEENIGYNLKDDSVSCNIFKSLEYKPNKATGVLEWVARGNCMFDTDVNLTNELKKDVVAITDTVI